MGGSESDGVAVEEEEDFFAFFEFVGTGARSVGGAEADEEEGVAVKEGISNASSAMVFSSSSRNLGCSSPRGANSVWANSRASGIRDWRISSIRCCWRSEKCRDGL